MAQLPIFQDEQAGEEEDEWEEEGEVEDEDEEQLPRHFNHPHASRHAASDSLRPKGPTGGCGEGVERAAGDADVRGRAGPRLGAGDGRVASLAVEHGVAATGVVPLMCRDEHYHLCPPPPPSPPPSRSYRARPASDPAQDSHRKRALLAVAPIGAGLGSRRHADSVEAPPRRLRPQTPRALPVLVPAQSPRAR
eukprot:363755-Chlamydomonas_euryale.AAC.4